MDAGGLAQMSHQGFAAGGGLAMPSSGLASRRGGQNIKPLSIDALKAPADTKDNGVPTPRTSRSHLLAGLRTAPKSATAATFPASPTTAAPTTQVRSRNSAGPGVFGQDNIYAGPKTSLPRYGRPQGFGQTPGYGPQYQVDQILAPPEIHIDGQEQDQMDPQWYAQMMAANAHLAQQQQRLQQQLLNVQAAQLQFQTLNLNQTPQAAAYQQLLQQQQQQQQLQQQQQQLRNLQQHMMTTGMSPQGPIYAVVDPMTGQQTYFVDQSLSQLNTQVADQWTAALQQQLGTPSVQVSPPTMEAQPVGFRNTSPPRRFESSAEPTPLPPPSANAFRRGHKKSSSTAGLSVATQDAPKTAGPMSAHFPLTPSTGSYGPGQARAGEHPIRQPRNPPSFDEIVSKPTSKHEGSKNFVTRTRRSAVNNLTRAGISRRTVANPGSSGSISPISESAEELVTPMTDDDSDSGRSGSGSLNGEDVGASLPSSRTSTASWGAIGSDRPGSRQQASRKSVDSLSDNDGSFAAVFKSATKAPTAHTNGSRRAPMLVLNNVEKRKSGSGM
jgi:hypothetical protein